MFKNSPHNKWAPFGPFWRVSRITRTTFCHAKGLEFVVLLILFTSTLAQPAACLPWRPEQPSSQVFYLGSTSLAAGPGGCTVSYYDESMAPIAPMANGAANYLLANGATFANAPSQMSAQQQQQQLNQTNNSSSGQQAASIGLECQYISAEQLHERFNRIKPTGLKVTSLVVKDSNLTTLGNMPQGIHELRKLIISNTSIDLEVLKEGSESLDQLTTLEITNEKISNIPQNFFQEMSSLKELRLENDEIASLDSDAFHNLDDSLEVLDLKRNRFNRFPMAVKNLAQLAVLDLSDNEIVIDTQENDLPEKLEPLLNLRELAMNRINCTCEFSSSPFFEWIARTHISGVRCFAPEKLKYQEVIVFERDEFCARTSAASAAFCANNYIALLIFIAHLVLASKLVTQNFVHLRRSNIENDG